jgi:hypothetical protein
VESVLVFSRRHATFVFGIAIAAALSGILLVSRISFDLDRYVEALRHAPEIESVDAQLFEPGKDWSYLSDRELYLLGADGAAAALARFERVLQLV